jgi:alpha-L-rhamnosidase
MNSFNHYAYGSIGEWLYRVVAGINTDEEKPGYKHILIRPQPNERLSYAKALLESMYGIVKSEWKRDAKKMRVNVCIPANATATVILPSAVLGHLAESGHSIEKVEGVFSYTQTHKGVEIILGSGTYQFEYVLDA